MKQNTDTEGWVISVEYQNGKTYKNDDAGNLQYIKDVLAQHLGDRVSTPRGEAILIELWDNGDVVCTLNEGYHPISV